MDGGVARPGGNETVYRKRRGKKKRTIDPGNNGHVLLGREVLDSEIHGTCAQERSRSACGTFSPSYSKDIHPHTGGINGNGHAPEVG